MDKERYNSIRIEPGAYQYIPFDTSARNVLRDGMIPLMGKYIKYK